MDNPRLLVVESILVASIDEKVDRITVTSNSCLIATVLELPPEVEICWNGGNTLIPEPLLIVIARGTPVHQQGA